MARPQKIAAPGYAAPSPQVFLPPVPMPLRHALALPTVALLAALLAAGCAPTAPALTTLEAVPIATGGDGLLDRPDLQHLVERQARRDTAALVAALAHSDAALRARAALGLASLQARSAVPSLAPLLDDADPTVRAYAAFAIGQSAQAEATGPLLDALRQEPDEAVRRALLDALGRSGDRAALAALGSLSLPPTLDADRAMAMARFGLRGVHDGRAAAWLAARLTAPDERLRRNAAYYFGRLRDTAPWADHADEIRAASETLAPEDPAQLHLALVLGRMEDRELPLLRLLTESADWRVRVNAARALSGTEDPGAAWALRTALADASEHVAVAAAETLSGMDLPDALLADLAASPPDRPMVAAAALGSLARNGRVGAAAHQARAFTLSSGSLPYARAAAVRAIAPAPGTASLAFLADASADADARVSYAALDALRTRWTRERSDARAPFYFALFAEALRRADAATAYAAAPALSDSLFRSLGAGEVMREVYAALEAPRDIEPMLEIVRAHGAARDTAAITFLLGVALEGSHPLLRHAATNALDERFGEGVDFEPTGLDVPAFPRLDWQYLRRLGPVPRLVLETDRGGIILELFTELAPVTVQTIATLAERGSYDGVPFHRVVPNFVVQGGDFERADGFGGPGFYLPSEFTPVPYEAGTLGMASAGKDTEGSQFFVTHSMQPHLDGRYTAFGRVLEGQAVVDALQPGDRILRARLAR
jgi:cyclophilin family peptidyl-prolyl cis-trans isomerase/HEAT repeat protein